MSETEAKRRKLLEQVVPLLNVLYHSIAAAFISLLIPLVLVTDDRSGERGR